MNPITRILQLFARKPPMVKPWVASLRKLTVEGRRNVERLGLEESQLRIAKARAACVEAAKLGRSFVDVPRLCNDSEPFFEKAMRRAGLRVEVVSGGRELRLSW